MANMISIIVGTFVICISIYNLVINVFLRKPPRLPLPPGPRPWPIIGNIPQLGPMPHQSTARLAREYGPLLYLRLGSVDAVVATSALVVSQFLKTHDANFSNRPPNSSAKHIVHDYNDMVFGPYGPRWRLLRKISSVHLFSSKALEDFRHVREEEVGNLIAALARVGPGMTKMFGHLYTCNTNAIGRMVLGQRLIVDDDVTDARGRELNSLMEEVKVVGGGFNVGDFIPWLHWLDLQGIERTSKSISKRLDSILIEIIKERRKELAEFTGKRNDLLSVMVSMQECIDEDGKNLTDTEMMALIVNMFVAGIDTTASAVEWTMAEAIKNPRIMSLLRDELDSVVGPDRLVMETDLPSLTYLQAVIKEALRLHPPTPLSVPRMATESCEINGYHIPKGTALLTNIWAIGRDPNVWSDPSVFKPERFMAGGERPEVDVKGNDFEVIPFGAGRRICVGVSFALRMTQLMVATLIHSFDWVCSQDMIMEESFWLFLKLRPPLMVGPKPRLSPHVYEGL